MRKSEHIGSILFDNESFSKFKLCFTWNLSEVWTSWARSHQRMNSKYFILSFVWKWIWKMFEDVGPISSNNELFFKFSFVSKGIWEKAEHVGPIPPDNKSYFTFSPVAKGNRCSEHPVRLSPGTIIARLSDVCAILWLELWKFLGH